MFCKKCGKQLPDDAKFCFGCGTALENESVQPESKENTSPEYSDDFSDDEALKQSIAELDRQYNDAKLKKKKRKAWIVLAVICLIFLLIGGVVGFLIMNNFSASDKANPTGTNQQADSSAKFVGTAKLDDIDFSIEVKSENIYDGVSITFQNGYETDVKISNDWVSNSAVVILTDTEGNKYNSIIDWNNLFMSNQLDSTNNSTKLGGGEFSVGTNYTVKVTYDNLPSGTVADSITIENIMTFKTARNPKSVKIDNTIPEAEQNRAKEVSKEETAESSAETVESKVSQAETSQKPSEASKEETAESSAETVESKVSQAESSQSTSEPSKAESKTAESSTEQAVKSSSRFKGSTRIEKYNFTIDADSDNIYDGITLHFKNEGSGEVFVLTEWMSASMDVILTDKNGNNYTSNIGWQKTVFDDNNQYEPEYNSIKSGDFKSGSEYKVKAIFKDLPEGTTAETITVKYLGTMSDFLDSSWSSYLDKVSTAVIQNNA